MEKKDRNVKFQQRTRTLRCAGMQCPPEVTTWTSGGSAGTWSEYTGIGDGQLFVGDMERSSGFWASSSNFASRPSKCPLRWPLGCHLRALCLYRQQRNIFHFFLMKKPKLMFMWHSIVTSHVLEVSTSREKNPAPLVGVGFIFNGLDLLTNCYT